MGVEGTETRIASCGDVLLGRVVRVCGGGVVALISLLVGPFLVARRRQIDAWEVGASYIILVLYCGR